MPVWTWDEASVCISKHVYNNSTKALYPKVNYEKAKTLFEKWEGVLQVVLQDASRKAINIINQEMEAAIGTCDFDMIVRIIGDVVDPRLEVNNKVVHIYTSVPDEEPNNADMDVYKEHDDDNTMDICKDKSSFIPYTQQMMGYETLQGNIFEAVAYKILRTGGEFETHCLKNKNDEIIKMTFFELEYKIFQSIDNINTLNKYYQS
ncbi:20599_t:CDS:2 [Gigaspora margarita]|uniref:20599_t:CDS:1 n=1 Tax=Gigaspora margarita TaxID=4874 RepID=A0ABM8VVR7_GIGMA|nr:20599_t:CDS:2 [Gigaspora margarita]